MLKRFEVENYRGFESRLIFDLTAGRYDFNHQVESEGLVKNAIVYGPNGIGKTALGTALFDITLHLTDKEHFPAKMILPYQNLNHAAQPALFRFEFQFGDDFIVYEYSKSVQLGLHNEHFVVNGEKVIDYDYVSSGKKYIKPGFAGTLNLELNDNKLSIIRYIYRNTPTDSVPTVSKMVRFVESMLWYRSLTEGNMYAGFQTGSYTLDDILAASGKIDDFRRFLAENGVPYQLSFKQVNGKNVLFAKYKEGEYPFENVASTGTMALYLFYTWSLVAFPSVSLLFIDEFDAFLHYEAAESVVKRLNGMKTFQTILTTHNTSLLTNKLTRPDCSFLLSYAEPSLGGAELPPICIKSLAQSTDREIRQVHNLEKMYRGGAFNA